MALPTIHFNSSTGSDTAASGAGPGDGTTGGSAVTGIGAAHTGGSASTTITLTNTPDLSAVLADGSHAIWLDTASGRKWSKITAVDDGADTVTVEDSFNIAAGSPVDYAIGGKRLDINSTNSRNLLVTSLKPGWKVDLEDGTYTLTSRIDILPGSAILPVEIFSSTATRAIVQCATNNVDMFEIGTTFVGYRIIRHIEFIHTAATRGLAFSTATGNPHPNVIIDCVIDGCRYAFQGDNGAYWLGSGMSFINCEIKNCTSGGILAQEVTNNGEPLIFGCYIHDNNGPGFIGSRAVKLINCVIVDNVGDGIECSANGGIIIVNNCIIANNGGDGISMGSTGSDGAGTPFIYAINSIIYGNGAFGITFGANGGIVVNANTAYGANTSGNFGANITELVSTIVALSGDPFTNAAAGDYTLNNTAGAGASCREAGFPGAWDSATMTGYMSIGTMQLQSGGGSGSSASAYAFA